jgi:hypothetical protein
MVNLLHRVGRVKVTRAKKLRTVGPEHAWEAAEAKGWQWTSLDQAHLTASQCWLLAKDAGSHV